MTKLLIAMGLFGIIKIITGCSGGSFSFHYGYNVSDGKVYYKQPFPKPVIEMEGVDAGSFKVMSRPQDSSYADNTYYATDKHSVYYQGRLVKGSDGPSFQLIDINYAKDNHQCYYRGSRIEGADPTSFTVKRDNFSADKTHIYKRDIEVDNDASVFEVFYEGYVVHTANTVCVYDAVVPVPAGAVFHHLGQAYFALNKQVYCQGSALLDGDVEGFAILEKQYAKTSRHVYYFNKLLTGADPVTYRLLQGGYGRDAAHVFFFEKLVDDADVNTFEVINEDYTCARDKNKIYHQHKPITGFTTSDLANKARCITCDEASIHFAQ